MIEKDKATYDELKKKERRDKSTYSFILEVKYSRKE
jgi:hypothetical protein